VQGSMDGVEGTVARGSLLDDGVSDLTQSRPDAVDPAQVTRGEIGRAGGHGTDAVGSFAVDDAPPDEPLERGIERRKALDAGTILEVIRVQEVEGVIEAHVMGVTP
jgi:hypothetical protein